MFHKRIMMKAKPQTLISKWKDTDIKLRNLQKIIEIGRLFNERFPVGSTVHISIEKFLDLGIENEINFVETSTVQKNNLLKRVFVTSPAIPLIKKNALVFLCSESKDSTDFYNVVHLKEYFDLLEDYKKNKGEI